MLGVKVILSSSIVFLQFPPPTNFYDSNILSYLCCWLGAEYQFFAWNIEKVAISNVKYLISSDNLVLLFVGDVTSMATIPIDMEVEANFLAKEDGIVAGIALAEMVFQEVDPSLKVSALHCVCNLFEWLLCLAIKNVHFNFRWIGLKKMGIMFIKDCSLEKFMVSQKKGIISNILEIHQRDVFNPYKFMCRTGTQHRCSWKGSAKLYAEDEWNSNSNKGIVFLISNKGIVLSFNFYFFFFKTNSEKRLL